MIHYTVNTGHSRVSPSEEVCEATIAVLQRMLRDGVHVMPQPLDGYSVEVTVCESILAAAVYAPNDRPCIHMTICVDDEDAGWAWKTVQRVYHEVTDMLDFRAMDWELARQPETTPWCAVVLEWLNEHEALWLGDFERCLAWAWINHWRNNR